MQGTTHDHSHIPTTGHNRTQSSPTPYTIQTRINANMAIAVALLTGRDFACPRACCVVSDSSLVDMRRRTYGHKSIPDFKGQLPYLSISAGPAAAVYNLKLSRTLHCSANYNTQYDDR